MIGITGYCEAMIACRDCCSWLNALRDPVVVVMNVTLFSNVTGYGRLLYSEDGGRPGDWDIRRALHPRGMQHCGGEAGRLSVRSRNLRRETCVRRDVECLSLEVVPVPCEVDDEYPSVPGSSRWSWGWV